MPPAATAREALPPPTPLMAIRFTFERKEWPLHQLVGNVKEDVQKSQKSIKTYLEKPTRRALKRGQQRMDIGQPPPGAPDWPALTKRARLGAVSSDLATAERPIESLEASVFNAAFVLRETDARQQQRQEMRNSIAAVLQGISDMSWKGWRNPFATVRHCPMKHAENLSKVVKAVLETTNTKGMLLTLSFVIPAIYFPRIAGNHSREPHPARTRRVF